MLVIWTGADTRTIASKASPELGRGLRLTSCLMSQVSDVVYGHCDDP